MLKQPYFNAEDDYSGGGGDDDGFEDVVIDEPTETTEPTEETTEQVEDTKPTEPVEEPKEQPKIKLKYNHEEKEYSLDDVVPLAQKGLNYDKLQEKFNEIQNNPALSKYSKVQEISGLLGYQSDDELLDALYNTYYSNQAESQGLTPEQIRKDYELSAKEKSIVEKERSLTKQETDSKMFTDFANNFPDVKAEMISQDTWDKVRGGMDLSTAYTLQQNKELQEKIKIFEQNQKNQTRAPISGVSKNGTVNEKTDAFLEGFDED